MKEEEERKKLSNRPTQFGVGNQASSKANREAKRLKKEQESKLPGFTAVAGQTPGEVVDRNMTRFLNAVFKKIENGDERLAEIVLNKALSNVNMNMESPLQGLGELSQIPVEELIRMRSEIRGGR